jgi:hypothetical protein
MGGALHYGLQLDTTTGLPSRVWYDFRFGKTSPNAEKPVLYADRVIYVVDNKLVIRPVAGGSINTDIQPNVGGGTITTSPTLVQEGNKYILFVGTSNGYVMSSSLTNNGSVGTFYQVGYTGYNETLNYVLYSKTTQFEYITAQSKTRITNFKHQFISTSQNVNGAGNSSVGTTNYWIKIWTTTLGSSQEWDFNNQNNTIQPTIIPPLPTNGEITDRVTSLAGFVGVPFTVTSNDNNCISFARLYLVPLDTTWHYYSTYYFGQVFTSPYVSLGTNTAYSAQPLYLNGRIILHGHSEQNSDTSKEGLDNPLEFFPIPPNKGSGRRGWREIIKDLPNIIY